MLKKIDFKTIFLIILMIASFSFAADLDFDIDNDSKIDDAFLDFSWDITGAVECDGAGNCTQAEYEDLSNYNALDPDYLTGDTTDDNLIDVAVINTTALKTTLSVDDLITLSGRAEGSQHLGTFTGSTIDDNLTIKAAFQDLETYVESLGGGHDPVTLSTTLNSNLLGISTQELSLDSQAANLVFSGPTSGGATTPTFRLLVAADLPDLSATYQTILTNEAGLYSALSDVSQFYEPGDTIQINSGTSLPGSCTTGEIFLDTDADSDGTVYVCRDTDTWKDIDDDGSEASDVLAKVSSNETDADYLVNQIAGGDVSINVAESGTGDETLQITVDVTPDTGNATLVIEEDAVQVKYKAADFSEGADGLEIDYTNGQEATGSQDGFLSQTDWTTFNNKESETHASEHAVGAADPVFSADPNFNGIFTWDDTGGVTEWGTSADLSYDGSTWTVVDDSHDHTYATITSMTSSEFAGIISNETGTGNVVFSASPIFTTRIATPKVQFTDEATNPTVVGNLKYNNTITGLIDGGLVWYDDDEVQLIVSVPLDNFGSGPTDDYVLCYDAINDEHYYCEASGVGGNTKFNLIEDADADGSIALTGFEQEITTTIDESGGVALTIKHTDSDGITNDTYLMEFIHANDGDAQAHFMRGLDNTSDELWKIAYDGTATFKQVNTSGSDLPGFTANDLQNPGSDKEIGKIYWNYLSGADGAEDGGVYLQTMVAGTERTIFEYDADTEVITLGDDNTGEDLTFDFDTGTPNEIDIASNSGVTVLDLGSITIQTSNPIGVSSGGTGAGTFTDHGVLVGSGTDAITALTVGTNGQLLIGSTGADPVFATLTCGDGLSCTTGAGTLEIDFDGLDTPQGELGGTWSSPTIDAEFKTRSETAFIEDPASGGESLDEIIYFPVAITITRISCVTDTGTATLNVENGANDVLSADIVCDADEQDSCASGCDVNTINASYDNFAANTWGDIAITSTASSPTKVSVAITYTVD